MEDQLYSQLPIKLQNKKNFQTSISILLTELSLNVQDEFSLFFFKNKTKAIDILIEDDDSNENELFFPPDNKRMTYIPVSTEQMNDISKLDLDLSTPISKNTV